ncbi:hypothetical protein STEG23_010756 [Scotinomys teguina]
MGNSACSPRLHDSCRVSGKNIDQRDPGRVTSIGYMIDRNKTGTELEVSSLPASFHNPEETNALLNLNQRTVNNANLLKPPVFVQCTLLPHSCLLDSVLLVMSYPPLTTLSTSLPGLQQQETATAPTSLLTIVSSGLPDQSPSASFLHWDLFFVCLFILSCNCGDPS